MFTTFLVFYLVRVLKAPRTVGLGATVIASLVEVVVIFLAARLADRIGRRPVTAFGLLGASFWTFALFAMLTSGDLLTASIAATVGAVFHGFIVAGMSAFFVEQFPTQVRYTGFSFAYQLASVLSGSVAPAIGVFLLEATGSTVPVSLYAVAMAAPALPRHLASPRDQGHRPRHDPLILRPCWSLPMSKAFASQADLADKKETFTELAEGVFCLTAEGDPNSGVVVGDDSVLVIDTRATPAMARELVARVREVTDKPIRHVLLTHYHAVRVLGVAGYEERFQRHRQRCHPGLDRGARGRRTWIRRSAASRACSGPRRPSPDSPGRPSSSGTASS